MFFSKNKMFTVIHISTYAFYSELSHLQHIRNGFKLNVNLNIDRCVVLLNEKEKSLAPKIVREEYGIEEGKTNGIFNEYFHSSGCW